MMRSRESRIGNHAGNPDEAVKDISQTDWMKITAPDRTGIKTSSRVWLSMTTESGPWFFM